MANPTTVNMNFRINKTLKKEADELFKKLGMNTSVALNMFLRDCVSKQKISFEIDTEVHRPTRKLKKALREADDIMNGKKYTKSYNDVDEMFEDILNEN